MSMILGIDSSGKTAAACLLKNGAVVRDTLLDKGLTHSETLLPLVMDTLATTGVTLEELDALAVTVGPGSFTGLRIGLALAKGLALPGDIPLAPVSTLEALAESCGAQGLVVCALDARRGEVYWAAFDCGELVRRLTPDAASPVEDIGRAVDVAGKKAIFVGDGAELCYTIYDYVPAPDRQGARPGGTAAFGAARLALGMLAGGRLRTAAGVRPHYLRQSQAQREREKRLGPRGGPHAG